MRDHDIDQGPSQVEGVDAFGRRVLGAKEPDAVRLHRAHQLALFRYLPAIVRRAMDPQASGTAQDVEAVLKEVPLRGSDTLAAMPGRALVELLGMIDTRPELFRHWAT